MLRQTLQQQSAEQKQGFAIKLSPGHGMSVIRLSGAVSVRDSSAFESALLGMAARFTGSAVLDLHGLSFINVIGLGVIVRLGNALASRGDRLVLHGAQPNICRLIRAVRLHEIISPDEPCDADQPIPLHGSRRALSTCA